MCCCRCMFMGGFSAHTRPGHLRAPSRKDSASEKPTKTIGPFKRSLNPYLGGLPNLDDVITHRGIHQLYHALECAIDLHRRSGYNKVHSTSFGYLVSSFMTTEVTSHSISEYMKINNGKGSTMVGKLLQAPIRSFSGLWLTLPINF